MSSGAAVYPRPLTEREKSWLLWILPEDRPGYHLYRQKIDQLLVIGEGRRGSGNLVLGTQGESPDLSSPLSSVYAYGVIESREGVITILVREESGGQIEVEVIPMKTESVPEEVTEQRRWTYSSWLPGLPCPCCNDAPREVPIKAAASNVVLAICPKDHRIWVYESSTGVNHLVPVTNFYNELMLHRRIRDPKVALDPGNLFTRLSEFTDDDLGYAFHVYNKIRRKVGSSLPARGVSAPRKPRATFWKRIFSHLR